jgi:hypothetical protein
LNDTLYNVVQGLPNQYANLTTFTALSADYDLYKINNNSNIDNLTEDLSALNTNINDNYVNNTTLTAL